MITLPSASSISLTGLWASKPPSIFLFNSIDFSTEYWMSGLILSDSWLFVCLTLSKNISDCVFYLQIEEPQLAKSRDSFIKLGFTHALEIPGFDNGAEYLHKTFALCKGNAQWKNAVHIDSIISKEAA